MRGRQGRQGRRRLLVVGFVVAVALTGGFALWHVTRAATAADAGRAALASAESSLSQRDLEATRENLTAAHKAFTTSRSQIQALGPIASVVRRAPLLGNQLEAVEVFSQVGADLSDMGQSLVNASETVLHPPDEHLPISAAIDALRQTQQSLGPAVAAVTAATTEVTKTQRWFLLGPLRRARSDLAMRLPRIQSRATSADHGLAALLAFAGEASPTRYLFLSQNPDEVRPTGGFIGTYGVLTAEHGQMQLERYDSIENWLRVHPGVNVPPDQAGSPFQYHDPPLRRTLANVNASPDWPQAAELAMRLWATGGELPVDGVISFTPGFMARILSVTGPVVTPSYGETVTAENITERLDFYTHHVSPPLGADRKDFVAAVAEVVMRKLLDAPASQWEPLGRAMGQAFDAREALAWSADPQVAPVLAERRWDGAFPAHTGDFLFNSEFEYAAKNGRGIRRVYDHDVTIRADGSAHVITRLTITNTDPPDPNSNPGTLAYLTLYGPTGGVLDEAASDPFGLPEPALAGHPARGWFRAAEPNGGKASLTVVWDVPNLIKHLEGDAWEYSLRWLNTPDHTGDVVNLQFSLPDSWNWRHNPPPLQLSLDREVIESWILRSAS